MSHRLWISRTFFDLESCGFWFWTVNQSLLKARSCILLCILVQNLKCLRTSLNVSTWVLSMGLYLSATHECSVRAKGRCSVSCKTKCYDSAWLPVNCKFNRSAKYFSSGTNFRTAIDFRSFKSFSYCNYDYFLVHLNITWNRYLPEQA